MSRKRSLIASKNVRKEITNFFKSIIERRFSDAERTIGDVRKKWSEKTDFYEGYLNALEGMLSSSRSGDERDFLNRAPFDEKSIKQHKGDFSSFLKEGVHTLFDTGYFSAWSDFMQYRISQSKN